MINASQIKEHMEVRGADGHIGTVLNVEVRQMKIASGVDVVEGDSIRLKKTAEDTART